MDDRKRRAVNPNINRNPKNLKKDHLRKEALKKKRRRKKIKKTILSIFMVIVIIFVCIGGYFYSFLGNLSNNNNLPSSIKAKSGEPINILVVGMDIGDTENLQNKSARRTDTIMVVNYNPNTKKMHIVSVPRDTMIEEDGYIGDGQYQRNWKINSAYVLGGEKTLVKHVESLLSIKINNIVEIDYNAFRNLIDTIGPIEMHIKQNMFYDDDGQNLHINFKAGETVQLDGKKAEEFFRWRKNNDGTGLAMGDIDRINNQHEFIQKVIDRCLTPSIIFKIPKILKTVGDNVTTNLTANNIVSLGFKALRLKSQDIIMTTLKGNSEDIYGQSFFIADKKQNLDLIKALNTTNSSDISNSQVDKKNIKIMVLNATSTPGLAGNLKTELLNAGYGQVDVGNAKAQDKSVIQTKDDSLEDVIQQDVKKIAKLGTINDTNYENYDVVIILGQDYNIFGN